MSDFGIEHTADAECINIHSDKDISVYAVHDRKTDILHDEIETITNNRSVTVKDGKSDFKVNTGPHTEVIKGAVSETFLDTQTTTVTKEIVITSNAFVHLTAADKITFDCGESMITMEKNGAITIRGKNIKIIGGVDIQESAPKIGISADDEAKLGVGDQNITCDKAKTAIAGKAINSSAKGNHEITGALVKIN